MCIYAYVLYEYTIPTLAIFLRIQKNLTDFLFFLRIRVKCFNVDNKTFSNPVLKSIIAMWYLFS